MPTSFLSADAGFPRLTNDIPMEERMNRVQQYLYMLLEQLRYALSNLSEDNFNEADLKELQEETVSGIRSVVTDLAGNVSTLEQTASSLTSQISDIEGNVSTLQQTAQGLTTRVSDAEGNISTLQQTASGLVTTVSDLGGDISVVSQKADRIDWIVASGTSASTMTMTPEAIDVIADGIGLTGTVTFNTLSSEDGTTVIDGNNIELWANDDGDSISKIIYRKEGVVTPYGDVMGRIYTIDNHTQSQGDRANYAFVIETPSMVDGDFCALKLVAGDAMSLESRHLIYLEASNQIILNSRYEPARIQANVVFDPNSSYCQSATSYYFCTDGIYFGSTKIVNT